MKKLTKSESIKLEKEFTAFAHEFLKVNYNLELTVPIKINGRLTASNGHIKYKGEDNKPEFIEIKIAKKLVEYGTEEGVYSTIKHELIHYALGSLNLPWDDGDDYFEAELLKHDSIRKPKRVGEFYTYECKCGKSYEVTKISEYLCNSCGTSNLLTLVNKVESDGFETTVIAKYK